MVTPYRLTVVQAPGVEILHRRYPTFAALLSDYREVRRKYPDPRKYAFFPGNADKADAGFDGLTDEEDDALMDAAVEVRREREALR